jgi:hypothetical protein
MRSCRVCHELPESKPRTGSKAQRDNKHSAISVQPSVSADIGRHHLQQKDDEMQIVIHAR